MEVGKLRIEFSKDPKTRVVAHAGFFVAEIV